MGVVFAREPVPVLGVVFAREPVPALGGVFALSSYCSRGTSPVTRKFAAHDGQNRTLQFVSPSILARG